MGTVGVSNTRGASLDYGGLHQPSTGLFMTHQSPCPWQSAHPPLRWLTATAVRAGRRAGAGGARTGGGVSWQITPRVLIAAISDPDPAAAQRAFAAMIGMGKIDVAAIEAARRD